MSWGVQPWGVTAWSGPYLAGGPRTVKPRAEDLASLFGREVRFSIRRGGRADYTVTPAGSLKLSEGIDALARAALRRVMTDPEEWPALADYGVGARKWIKAKDTRANRDELAERVRSQLSQEPRIRRVDRVAVRLGDQGVTILASLVPISEIEGARPFDLRVEVT